MATAIASDSPVSANNGFYDGTRGHEDLFIGGNPDSQPYLHRFSSRFDLNHSDVSVTSSPSQAKRMLEAHLLETQRRLENTKNLGESLLEQQEELSNKLREVEMHQDETEIPTELRQRLAEIEREHDDVGREVARALIGPKSRPDESNGIESGVFSSQASGSPSKVSAPNRRSRNQPTNRAGDLQFAADISTSLLAQVRQLQAAVAERDESIKRSNLDREQLEQDLLAHSQRLRVFDESEQRYKDENWNLETRNHELLSASRDAGDREKRMTGALSVITAERYRLQSDLEELKSAHSKLNEDHAATRKAHDSEIHTLKRTVDVGDTERLSLQKKIEDLTSQNHELAKAMASRLRNEQLEQGTDFDQDDDDFTKELDTPEHSPPPSPTKGTPRHGGLESETLRSSLHHAHRMIQNLKGNIHREKTEKIELKRMLQEARDELESRRDGGVASATKRQKTRSDPFKKPARPDQLGGNRRARTDVDLQEEGWEDHNGDSATQPYGSTILAPPHVSGHRYTDVSDAYQTANETENAFETADERHATESEAFMTGVESLAGDSTDELTETEDMPTHTKRMTAIRSSRPSNVSKQPGDRISYLSTASTSGDEDDQEHTPLQPALTKFRLRNGRQSYGRNSRSLNEGTPEAMQSQLVSEDSPATITHGRSPPAGEQSLFAELGDFDDMSSDIHSTPARSGIVSHGSSPTGVLSTPSRTNTRELTLLVVTKPQMVDSSTMTEPWTPMPADRDSFAGFVPFRTPDRGSGDYDPQFRAPSPSDFPLPPSVPTSPDRTADMSTQYTPRAGFADSPTRGKVPFITPPRTVWDDIHDPEQSMDRELMQANSLPESRNLGFSGVLSQNTVPTTPSKPLPHALNHDYSGIVTQETQPISPAHHAVTVAPTSLEQQNPSVLPKEANNTEKIAAGTAVGGLLASAAAVFGYSNGRAAAEDKSREQVRARPSTPNASILPFNDAFGNNDVYRPSTSRKNDPSSVPAPLVYSKNDQSSQTMLTAEQIEEALKPRTISPIPPATVNKSFSSRSREAVPIIDSSGNAFATNPLVRPPSATSSHRASSLNSQVHPPLPSDHRSIIAKANNQATSPIKQDPSPFKTGGVMGPPTFPASAMRRPKTPSDSVRSPSREPRASQSSRHPRHERGTMNSQLSHRSSVSSFASELDERFNIRPDTMAAGQGFEATPGTDPRMIQAITQTMIGEFLWKYTRRPGSKDMSSTRHRRYFWVHPYTKTLYWSDHDPQTAGRTELKAKSVAIQSVRVVSDDNPMPPGLHRKSLEVMTPGRMIKFTAATGQRHETWFNALSYLLLRGEPPDTVGAYSTGGNAITRDDIDEFNGNGYGARLVPSGSRLSMSSYNSRTTRGTSAHRASAAGRSLLPAGVITSSHSTGQTSNRNTPVMEDSFISKSGSDTPRHYRTDQSRDADKDRPVRAGSVSQFSRIMGSVTGRGQREDSGKGPVRNQPSRSENGSIYDASLVSGSRRDSAEEMRREMLRQEQAGLDGGLENVRACCDGKHDVSTLHRHGTAPNHVTNTSLSHAIGRSVSRRAHY